MRAPISVVIPALNAAAGLGPCLAALGEGLQEGLIRELILSDGGSTDDTRQIAEAAGAVWITGPAGRGGQLRRGSAAAEGAWLLFLHADTRLAPGWTAPVRTALGRPDLAGYFDLTFDSPGRAGRWVARWANLRSRRFDLPFGDQGLLISRELLDRVGGVPDMPLMEDVTLARALRGQLAPLKATAVTSAERYEREGWALRGGRNLWLQARFLVGADPQKLADRYRARRGD